MSKLPPATRRSALLAISLILSALVGCSQNTPLLNQPLAWAPTNSLALGVTESHGTPATVQFETFRDTAPNPSLVGENVENAIPRKVTTADPVGPFVTRHLQQLFAQAGYTSGGTSASRVISGEVSKFFVREGNTYNGTVVLKVAVTDRRGKVLWKGDVWGTNQTFGRSYHLDNYNQVLSDSLVDAADNLLKNPDFRRSLSLH